jgi:acyl carrier protein
MASVAQRVHSIASDVFGVPAQRIFPDSSPVTLERWDSTQHLTFVLALEESFQLQFSPEETERIRTIGDAVKLVEEKIQVEGK